ncbi:hypothetical protein BT69DRAFT_1322379 [Atractiella rhizophila]|nr:hypothetical protein BT69DRAFT_1322379 [Atractiella rhizophila]
MAPALKEKEMTLEARLAIEEQKLFELTRPASMDGIAFLMAKDRDRDVFDTPHRSKPNSKSTQKTGKGNKENEKVKKGMEILNRIKKSVGNPLTVRDNDDADCSPPPSTPPSPKSTYCAPDVHATPRPPKRTRELGERKNEAEDFDFKF